MNQDNKQHPSSGEDAAFDTLLRTAQVEVPLRGAFQSEVWRRIAVAQEITMAGRFTRHLELFVGALTRPMAAAVVLLAMISGGLWVGSLKSGQGKDAKLSYVQSISPFAHAHRGESR